MPYSEAMHFKLGHYRGVRTEDASKLRSFGPRKMQPSG